MSHVRIRTVPTLGRFGQADRVRAVIWQAHEQWLATISDPSKTYDDRRTAAINLAETKAALIPNLDEEEDEKRATVS